MIFDLLLKKCHIIVLLKACQTVPGYWTKLSFKSYCANTVKYTQGQHKQSW